MKLGFAGQVLMKTHDLPHTIIKAIELFLPSLFYTSVFGELVFL